MNQITVRDTAPFITQDKPVMSPEVKQDQPLIHFARNPLASYLKAKDPKLTKMAYTQFGDLNQLKGNQEPETGRTVVILELGQPNYKIGTFAHHERIGPDGQVKQKDIMFLLYSIHTAVSGDEALNIIRPDGSEHCILVYPKSTSSIYAWAYIDDDGMAIPPVA